jgi:hypothetical protein
MSRIMRRLAERSFAKSAIFIVTLELARKMITTALELCSTYQRARSECRGIVVKMVNDFVVQGLLAGSHGRI